MGAAVFPARADDPPPENGSTGASISNAGSTDFLAVTYVADGSPAALAGIKTGDLVTLLNGIAVQNLSPTQRKSILEGPVGSTVEITAIRDVTTSEDVSIVLVPYVDAYSPAAEAGDSRAEFNLAYYYQHASGPAKDLGKSLDWYTKAANAGYARAENNLGAIYKYGYGVPKDPVTAVAWFLKASQQGDGVSERELAECYLYGQGVAKSDQDAFNWFYASAQQDDAVAERHLGILYEEGRGVAKDNQAAFDWFYRAAYRNDAYGAWNLGIFYDRGRGVTKNLDEALKWYRQAQVALPDDKRLKRNIAMASLGAFLHSKVPSQLDASLFRDAFGRELSILFVCLVAVYLVIGGLLLYFTFQKPENAAKLLFSLGWIFLYMESQGVAALGLAVLAKTFAVTLFFIATVVCSTVPIILSSLGPARRHLWKRPPAPLGKIIFIYVLGAFAALLLIPFGYEKLYVAIFHSSLPAQSTLALILKTRTASVWLAYLCIALLMPATEEILFRGYLFETLGKRLPSMAVIVITAAAFSVLHFQADYLIPLFGIGLVLGWVRNETKSIFLTVLLHALNNSFSLALLKIASHQT